MGTRRKIFALTASTALLALTGCVTPPPAASHTHPLGVVRAGDAATAEHFGELVQDIQPRVAHLVPDTPERDTEVWVQEKLQHRYGQAAPPNVKGFTLIDSGHTRGRIHMRANTDYPEWFLAHELVHALLGRTWSTLPGVLEEGLCDVVAARLNPEVGPRIRALRAIEASMWFGKMRLRVSHEGHLESRGEDELDVWFHYDRGSANQDLAQVLEPSTLEFKRRFQEMSDSLYGLGFLIADRIVRDQDFSGLHNLCLDAKQRGLSTIPAHELLAQAGLTEPADRYAAPWELLGEAEFDPWVDLLPTFHADLIVQLFADEYGQLPLDRFLEVVDPKIHLAGGAKVRMAANPRVAEELARLWPTP